MMKTVIIGAGGISLQHVQAIKRLPDIEVAGVIDIKYDNAKRIADLCGARVVSRLEDIIDEVQMVHLLTPPSKRVEYAELAMKAGKHILCEKPIATNLKDAQTLLELSIQNNVIFMTGFNMRFRPGYMMLQEDVLSGKLGDIISIWCHRIGPGPGFKPHSSDSWRTDPELVCGMSIESLSHDIDMIRGLGVEIKNVFAWTKGTRDDLPTYDNNSQVIMELNNGASAVINASWSSHLSMSSRGVIGTKGTAVLSGDGFFDFIEYRIQTEDMEHEQVTIINDRFDGESYFYENKHFIDCIKNKKKCSITAENGLEALKVSLAILESDKKQCLVSI